MESEIVEVQSTRSLRIPRISSIQRDSDNLQYTSLKDIICNTPTKCSSLYEANEFDSSNITIRNELVKRAASVYLQSAAFLVTRNRNCFVDFWERLKNRVASCSCWRLFGGNTIRACLGPIFQFFNHMVGSFRSLPWRFVKNNSFRTWCMSCSFISLVKITYSMFHLYITNIRDI